MRAGCVICGDLFVEGNDVSATPCGHTFHSHCLLQWIERSKSCPQCRQKTTEKSMLHLYFDSVGVEQPLVDTDSLQNLIDNMKFQVKQKQMELSGVKEEIETLKKHNSGLRQECKSLESTIADKSTTILALKAQLQFMERITSEAEKAKKDLKSVREKLTLYKHVDEMISGNTEDINNILASYSGHSSSDDMKTLATYTALLNKEINKIREERKILKREILPLQIEVRDLKLKSGSTLADLSVEQKRREQLQDDVENLQRQNESLKKKLAALEASVVSPSADARNSAIHRLLSESPAPAELRHLKNQNSSDLSLTPKVVRTASRETGSKDYVGPETNTSSQTGKNNSSVSPYLHIKEAATGILPYQSQTRMHWQNHSHNIFSKAKTFSLHKRTGSLPVVAVQKRTRNEESLLGYDGLGGHTKHDEFPKPLKHAVKKRQSKVTVICSPKTTGSIKNYFQDTFEDRHPND